MTVLDVLKVASQYLQCENDFAYYFDETVETEPNAQTQGEFKTLLSALNNVVATLASSVAPCEKIEVVSLGNGGVFDMSTLDEKIVKVLGVKKDGVYVGFRIENDTLVANATGECEVMYHYLPATLESDDDIDFFANKNFVNEKTLALGVVSEYCLLTTLFDDHDFWQGKFERELNARKSDLSVRKVLKGRGWF